MTDDLDLTQANGDSPNNLKIMPEPNIPCVDPNLNGFNDNDDDMSKEILDALNNLKDPNEAPELL